MITLISANWILFLVALAIGVATAYWAWAGLSRNKSEAEHFDADDGLLEKADEVAQQEPETPPAPVKPAAAPVEPTAAPAGKPKIAVAKGKPDNLRKIKGIGPKLNKLLTGLGVERFDQIADWKKKDIAEVDQYLGTFSGRITRDAWIDQAKYLAKGDTAGYEKKYGKL